MNTALSIDDILESIALAPEREFRLIVDIVDKRLHNKELPISKNVPNAETVKALRDTDYEKVTLDELTATGTRKPS